MSAVLQYDISVVGAQSVERAFAGIERRLVQHNRFVASSMGRSAGGARVGAPGRAASGPGAMRGFDQIGRAARAADLRLERERISGERRVAAARVREQQKAIQAQAKAEQRLQAERLRATQRAAAAEVRTRQAFARATGGAVGRSVGGAVRTVGMLGTTALGLGGGFAMAGAIQHRQRIEAQAAALANQAYREGEGPSRQQIQSGVLQQATDIGGRTGLGAEGVLQGLRNFVSISGNLDVGQQLAPIMADIADATDADIADVGRTAGQIAQAMMARGLEAPEIIAQTTDIMASMAGQAKVGSIEFRDLAQQMGKVMSATAGYEGKVSDLATTMGAVAQISIAGGASSPEEAMTAIMRFRDDLIQNQGKFKKIAKGGGVNVFADDAQTQLRGPEDILFDMLKATGGSLPKVGELFGVRAQKAVQPFQEIFTKAGGGDAGIEEVRKLLDSVRGAKVSATEIRESAGFRRDQADKQFSIALGQLNAKLGEQLLPTVTKLIPKFEALIPHLTKAAEMFGGLLEHIAKDPIRGIGQLILAKVTLDLAGAGIGAAIRASLVSLLAGGGAASTAAGAAGAAGSGAAAAAGTAGLLATTVRGKNIGAAGAAAAGLAAVVGAAVADDQNERLKQETGGLGMIDLAKGMWEQGTFNPFEVVDAHMNEQARAEAAQRMVTDPIPGIPGEQQGATAAAPDLSPINEAAQETARQLQGVQQELMRTQQELSKIKGFDLNRGNAPSPVKG
jgi:hypothetical protein